ncbi:MAG: hypothetical protein ABJB39_04590 [Chloroflexota bacterium]
MRRHRDGEINDLLRNTIIWVVVLVWLAWSYIIQTPPEGPYTDGLRNAFLIALAIVIPVISAVVVLAWVGALRDRQRRQQ